MIMNDLTPLNGMSNRSVDSSAKTASTDMKVNTVKNGYSLWGYGTLTGSRTISMDAAAGKTGYGDKTFGYENSLNVSKLDGNSRLMDPSVATLLGPYSKPMTDVSESKLDTDINRQVFAQSISRPAYGTDWFNQGTSVANLLQFAHDANNNIVIKQPFRAWPGSNLSHSFMPPPPPSYKTRSENYVVTKHSGERVFKTKAAYVRTMSAKVPKPDNDPPKRIHVSNIPFWMTENDLLVLFKDFGTIQEVQVITNEKGSKGFGFVTFKKTSEADRAKSEMDEAVVDGRVIEVNDAHPKNHQRKPLLRLNSL